MAEMIGGAGLSATDESHKRFRWLLVTSSILSCLGGIFLGRFLIPQTQWLPSVPFIVTATIIAGALILLYLVDRASIQHERAWKNFRKGADGEALVAETLRSLPDGYVVINDIVKRLGNIDHVVIGPTGIYVINTKYWRGTVVAGSNDELSLNGKPTDKPEVKNLSHAVMDFHAKVKALCEKDYFVNGLMVFVSTYIDGNLGPKKHIQFLRDDRVLDFIANKKYENRLTPEDIRRIKRAVIQLAQMDEKFSVNAPSA